jgi:hypothetical protein
MLEDFVKTSHGAYELSVVTRSNIRAQKAEVIRTIAAWAWEAKQPPGKACICCDAEFTADIKPTAFLVLTPFIPSTKAAVVSGLCKHCYSTGNLKTKALLSWRKVLPNLSEIEGGRA